MARSFSKENEEGKGTNLIRRIIETKPRVLPPLRATHEMKSARQRNVEWFITRNGTHSTGSSDRLARQDRLGQVAEEGD